MKERDTALTVKEQGDILKQSTVLSAKKGHFERT